MSNKEYIYMKKCLIDSIDNLSNARSMHEVYYLKGIINTLQDILYKYCEDSKLDDLNRSVYGVCKL